MINWLKRKINKTPYQLSAADRQDADSAAVLAMLKVLIGVQVKSNGLLEHRHVAQSFTEQAAKLSAAAEVSQDMAKKDRAQLLHMSGVIESLAGEIKFEGVKRDAN